MLARHQLVWLDPDALAHLRPARDADRVAIAEWIGQGRPAVVRRSEVAIAGSIPLGIPLPERMGRLRISLFAPEDAILRSSGMPDLSEAAICAPAAWRESLDLVGDLLAGIHARIRVFGSLGWQHVTGETYLRAGSDLDLLIEPETRFDLSAAQSAFRRIGAIAVPRIDGELLIGADRAVSWRELLTPADALLVRSRSSASIEVRDQALALICGAAA